MYTYMEIRQWGECNGKDTVVRRYNLTGKSQREIDRIESGANINLNHEEFYTYTFETEAELEIIDKQKATP